MPIPTVPTVPMVQTRHSYPVDTGPVAGPPGEVTIVSPVPLPVSISNEEPIQVYDLPAIDPPSNQFLVTPGTWKDVAYIHNRSRYDNLADSCAFCLAVLNSSVTGGSLDIRILLSNIWSNLSYYEFYAGIATPVSTVGNWVGTQFGKILRTNGSDAGFPGPSGRMQSHFWKFGKIQVYSTAGSAHNIQLVLLPTFPISYTWIQ